MRRNQKTCTAKTAYTLRKAANALRKDAFAQRNATKALIMAAAVIAALAFVACTAAVGIPEVNKGCSDCGNDAIVWSEPEGRYVCADCFLPHDSESLRGYSGKYTAALNLSGGENTAAIEISLAGGLVNFSFAKGSDLYTGTEPLENRNGLLCSEFVIMGKKFGLKFVGFENTGLVCNIVIDGEEYTYVPLADSARKYQDAGSTAQNVRNTENAQFEVPGFAFEQTSDKNVIRIKANPKRGYWFDAFLWIPGNTESAQSDIEINREINNLYCECFLTASDMAANKTSDAAFFRISERTLEAKDYLKTPILVLAFPGYCFPETDPETKYTSMNRKGIFRRVDNQAACIIRDALQYLNENYAQMAPKVIMSGYSEQGTFTSVFSMLHPELVQAAVSGAAVPMLPVTELNGTPLPYPSGISDFECITGKPFNYDEWRTVRMLYTKGSWDLPNNSFPAYYRILNEKSDNAETVFYLHRGREEVTADALEFLKQNYSEEARPLVFSEDVRIVHASGDDEFVSENSVEFVSEKSFEGFGKLRLRLPLDARVKWKIVLDNRIPGSDLQHSGTTLDAGKISSSDGRIIDVSFRDVSGRCSVGLSFIVSDIPGGSMDCLVRINGEPDEVVTFTSGSSQNTLRRIYWGNSVLNSNVSPAASAPSSYDDAMKKFALYVDNSGSGFRCPFCDGDCFVYNDNHHYECVSCRKEVEYESVRSMLQGIWTATLDGVNYTLMLSSYSSPHKYLFHHKKAYRCLLSGNWFNEDDATAMLEFVQFDNIVFFFTSVSGNELLCTVKVGGVTYENVALSRAQS